LGFKSTGHRLVYEELEQLVGPGDIVLDVGCGNGSFLEQIVSDFGPKGIGIDPSASTGLGRRLNATGCEQKTWMNWKKISISFTALIVSTILAM